MKSVKNNLLNLFHNKFFEYVYAPFTAKRQQGGHHTMRKLFSCVALGVGLLILFQFTLFYWAFRKESLNTYYYASMQKIVQVQSSYQSMYKNLQNLMLNISFDDDIKFLLFDTIPPEKKPSEACAVIKKYSAYPNVADIYIFNEKRRMIYNGTNAVSADDFLDPNLLDAIYNTKAGNIDNFAHCIRKKVTDSSSRQPETALIYSFIFFPASNSKSAIVIDVDLSDYNKSAADYIKDNGSDLYVCDDSGNVIYGGISYNTLDQLSGTELFEERMLGEKNEYGNLVENGTRYMTTYSYSPQLNYWFISKTPYSILMDNEIFKNTYVLLPMIIAIILVGAVVLFPLFKMLDSAIRFMRKQLMVAESEANKRLQLAKEKVLKDLILSGEDIKQEKAAERIRGANIDFDLQKPMVCIRITIDNYSAFSAQWPNTDDHRLFLYAMTNICCEVVGECYPVESIYDGNSSIILVVGNTSYGDTAAFETLLDQCTKHINKYLELSVTVAIGSIRPITQIGGAYTELLQITESRFLYGANMIILPQMVHPDSLEEDNTDYETELKNALMTLKFSEAKELAIRALESFRRIYYKEARARVLHLSYVLQEAIDAYRQNSGTDVGLSFSEHYALITSAETLDEEIEIFSEVIEKCSEVFVPNLNNTHSALVDKAKEIIHEKLSDSGLCLDVIAHDLGLSSPYLSKLFRNQTMQSIPGYILELRLEKTREMLVSTNKTVKDIMTSVGFINNSYFTVVFKKRYGVTPSAFRNNYKLNS